MGINFLLSAGFIASALIALIWDRQGRQLPTGDRLLRAAFPLAFYLLIASFFSSWYQAPYHAWDGARLAPAIALWNAEPLYSTSRTGSVQTTMYPPFSAIAFAPAALFDQPGAAMLAGSLLAHCYYFFPVLYLCLSLPGDRKLSVMLLFLFVTVSFNYAELGASASRVHADAPALGLGLASCLVLSRAESSQQMRFGACGVLAWLSVWSKQPLLPLVGVLPLWTLLTHGRKAALHLTLWLAGLGVLIAAGFLVVFGGEGFVFNTVTIPKAMPWILKTPFNLAYVSMELLTYLLPILLVVLGCVVLLLRKDPVSELPTWLRGNAWLLLLITALALVPSSVLGRVKVGGALNNLSYTLYFALAATAMIMMRLADLWDRSPGGEEFDTFKRFTALAGILVALYGLGSTLQLRLHLLVPSRNENRKAYEYLVSHPSEGVYFPGQPLAHVLAEKSLPHLSLAVYDRDTQTPYAVGRQQIRAHVSANLSRICIGQDFRKESEHLVNSHFPDFRKPLDESGPFTCIGRR